MFKAPANTQTATIRVPINAEALWFFNSSLSSVTVPTVKGHTTGAFYPVYLFPKEDSFNAIVSCVAIICGALDNEVDIDWGLPPGSPWWAIADTAGRFVMDVSTSISEGTNSGVIPEGAIAIAGNDGNELHSIKVDSDGFIVPTAPIISVNLVGNNAAQTLLPAPAAGFVYELFGADWLWFGTGGATADLEDAGIFFYCLFGVDVPNKCEHVDLHGMQTNTAITFNGPTSSRVVLRYKLTRV